MGLIERTCFFPEWKITTMRSYTPGHILLTCAFATRNTNEADAPFYPDKFVTTPTTEIDVRPLDEEALYHEVVSFIVTAWEHEAREAFRVPDVSQYGTRRWRSPFHPHRREGVAAWRRGTRKPLSASDGLVA